MVIVTWNKNCILNTYAEWSWRKLYFYVHQVNVLCHFCGCSHHIIIFLFFAVVLTIMVTDGWSWMCYANNKLHVVCAYRRFYNNQYHTGRHFLISSVSQSVFLHNARAPYFIILLVNLTFFYCRTLTSITITTTMITTTITTIIKIWTENEDFPMWWSPKIVIVVQTRKTIHNENKISKAKTVQNIICCMEYECNWIERL